MERIIDYTARTPVWNGLGTNIGGCRTVEDALYQSGLDFEVHQADILTDELCDPVYFSCSSQNCRSVGISTVAVSRIISRLILP